MIIVLSVGGSTVNGNGDPDVKYLKEFAKILKKSKNRFGIVIGGGKIARVYANAARDLGASEYDADNIAITSTKQNAQLVIAALKSAEIDVYESVITDFEEARNVSNKIIVMGGTIPGITTDTDSVLLCEAIGGKKIVNISNVDGIYDSNPKDNPLAKKFLKMKFDDLITLASSSDKRKAGTNFVFDLLACKLIARSNIETHFVSNKLSEIEKAIEGKKHNGTIISNV